MSTAVLNVMDIGPNTKSTDMSEKALNTLCSRITPHEITIDHLRLALSGLRKELVPSGPGADTEDRRRAEPCSDLLSKCVAALKANLHPKDQAVLSLLIAGCDGICSWCHTFLLDSMIACMTPRPGQRERMWAMYTARSRTLLDLFNLHPTISKAYLRSDEMHKLMLYLWTTSDNFKKNSFFMDWAHPEEDGITQLALKVVEDQGGKKGLLRQSNNFTQKAKTHGPPCPPSIRFPEGLRRIATGLVHRAIKTREAIDDPARFLRGMVTFVGRLLRILEHLCEADDEELYGHLIEADYLTELSRTLHSAIVALGSRPPQEYLDTVLYGISAFTRIVGRQEKALPRNWRNVVVGGILQTTARAAACIPIEPAFESQRRLLETSCQSLSAATLYPAVMDVLLYSPDLLDIRDVEEDLKRTKIAPIWDSFWDPIQNRLKVYKELEKAEDLTMCDSPLCSQKVRETTLTCAGCCSIVYCSRKCQYFDWIRAHRKECRQARDYHREERSSKTWYSHRTRAFHVKLLENCFNAALGPGNQLYQPGLAPISVLDFCHKPPDGSSKFGNNTPVTTYDLKDGTTDHWMRRPDTQFSQKYLTPRLRALGRQVAPGAKEGELKMVEGRFPVANGIVMYTLVVLMKVEDRYEATYSISRHGFTKPTY